MAWIPDRLQEIYTQVEKGERPHTTVRQLLSWFGSYRRSWRNVAMIHRALRELKIQTTPNFEWPHIDAVVTFTPAVPADTPEKAGTPEVPTTPGETIPTETIPTETIPTEIIPTETAPSEVATTAPTPNPISPEQDTILPTSEAVRRVEPAHQISRLKSANTIPIFVKPDATIQEAITIMLMSDFSQLPVMQTDRDPKGIFSWRSLGNRLALGQQCKHVRECMDAYKELGPEASLYDAIPLIVQNECVLIRDGTRRICGIITPADLSAQFHELAEPFLLVGAIENQLRTWITERFNKEDLQAAKDPDDEDRQIEDAADLTFGEYVRLLENPANWEKLGTQIDRSPFIERLKNVRDVRNDVMHFDPDPMEPADLNALRSFALFLDRLEKLGVW